LSSRVFKNYQVNIGIPYQIQSALAFQTLKQAAEILEKEEEMAKDDEFNETDDEVEVLGQASAEAEVIIQEAKYEAERIIEEAQRTALENSKRIEEEARMKGFEEAFNEVKMQYEDLLQEAESIRAHARVEYSDVMASIESDAINIVLDVAKKVIGNEIAQDKESILSMIRQAFEKCSNKENAVLRVSPDDYEFVQENKDRLLSMIEGIGGLEIKKDPSLKAFGCIVETPVGSIDASLQTKLKKIEDVFREIIRR